MTNLKNKYVELIQVQYQNAKKVEKSYFSSLTTFVPSTMHQDITDNSKIYMIGQEAEVIKFDKNTLKVDW